MQVNQSALERAKQYGLQKRVHWGVYVDDRLADCALEFRDVLLRARSLYGCCQRQVVIRLCAPVSSPTEDGGRHWNIRDYLVLPPTELNRGTSP